MADDQRLLSRLGIPVVLMLGSCTGVTEPPIQVYEQDTTTVGQELQMHVNFPISFILGSSQPLSRKTWKVGLQGAKREPPFSCCVLGLEHLLVTGVENTRRRPGEGPQGHVSAKEF